MNEGTCDVYISDFTMGVKLRFPIFPMASTQFVHGETRGEVSNVFFTILGSMKTCFLVLCELLESTSIEAPKGC